MTSTAFIACAASAVHFLVVDRLCEATDIPTVSNRIERVIAPGHTLLTKQAEVPCAPRNPALSRRLVRGCMGHGRCDLVRPPEGRSLRHHGDRPCRTAPLAVALLSYLG